MDKETLVKYAPMVVVVLMTFVQCNIFVTPEKLEIKHREILRDVSSTYTTKEQYNDVKNQLSNMQQKIDKIYEIMTNK